jgi:hypothetical protein
VDIGQLEADIKLIDARRKMAGDELRANQIVFKEIKDKYEEAIKAWQAFSDKKNKHLESMNAQIMMFEHDKQSCIGQVASELQRVYEITHRPKIFMEYLNKTEKVKADILKMDIWLKAIETNRQPLAPLKVMTEHSEELNIANQSVVF